MSRNKIIVSAVAFIVVITLTVSFALLSKLSFTGTENYSEMFFGSISESAYEDKEEAAHDFVSKELTGATASPEYMGYTSDGELKSADLEEINSHNLIEEDFKSGEKVTIRYRNSTAENSVKAYLLDAGKKYRYFVLPPEEGGIVTNSYLNSVLDGEKYLNCTSTTIVGMSVLDIMTTYNQTIQFDNDKAYFKQEIPGLISDVYLEEYSGGITAYLKNPEKNDGKFYSLAEIQSYYYSQGYEYDLFLIKGEEEVNIDSLNSMQDVTDFCFMLDIDASYFVKTLYGFAMTEEKYKAVCKMLAGNKLGEEFDKAWNDYQVHFRADYYVSEGRLSKSEIVLNLYYDGNYMTVSLTSIYSDFGSTTVEMPER